MRRLLAATAVALALGACNDQYASSGRSLAPIPQRTMALMSEKGMAKSDPILVRLYKKESELEVWKRAADGKYAMLKTFPICRWSGQLGPKRREGDRQAPEGFYTINPSQLNPNSAYYLSFDTGYPNAYDRAHNGTGSALMVHGSCSSRGCYAMTDEGIAEVYALARESISSGQRGFQFQAYPFRMTAENLARYRADPNMPFWKNLKDGSDHFELTGHEPRVAVCGGRYAFDTVGMTCKDDPSLAPMMAQKQERDRVAVAELVAKGTPAVKLVYADGGGHESFRQSMASLGGGDSQNFSILDSRPRRNLGDVSRPDALAEGPREVPIEEKTTVLASAGTARKATSSRLAAAIGQPELGKPTLSAAKPARTVLASADPDEPLMTQSTSAPDVKPDSKPFYERMLGNVLGRSEPAPAATADTEAVPVPVDAPLPPRRQVAAPTPLKPVPNKPQASLAVPLQHASASAIPGTQATGPSGGSFKAN